MAEAFARRTPPRRRAWAALFWVVLFWIVVVMPCRARAAPILCQWVTSFWMSGPPEAWVLDESGHVRSFSHESVPQRPRDVTAAAAVRLAAQAAPAGDPVPAATMERLRTLIGEAQAGTIVTGPTGSRGAQNSEIRCFVAAPGTPPRAVLLSETGSTNRSNTSGAASELIRMLAPVIGPPRCRARPDPASEIDILLHSLPVPCG